MEEYPEFSAQAVADGYWEIYHDDDCGSVIINGRCLACNRGVDMQSLSARRTKPPRPEYNVDEVWE